MNRKKYTDMRDAIFEEIYGIAEKNKSVIILSADNGAAIFKKFEENLPSQFLNVGIAEQNAMSVAAGLAITGHRVFVVGIANFVTLRCFEQLKNDIVMMNLPVTILASGTGYFYGEDGPTHHMIDNLAVMRALPGFQIWCPSSFNMGAALVHEAYKANSPSCIWFDRGPFASLEEYYETNFSIGSTLVRPGNDLTIVSYGIMVGEAFKIAEAFKKISLNVGVLDIYRLKPLNRENILKIFKETKRVATLEEHSIRGGLSGIVNEFLAENDLVLPVKHFGIPDIFHYEAGSRAYMRVADGLDAKNVAEKIRRWIQK